MYFLVLSLSSCLWLLHFNPVAHLQENAGSLEAFTSEHLQRKRTTFFPEGLGTPTFRPGRRKRKKHGRRFFRLESSIRTRRKRRRSSFGGPARQLGPRRTRGGLGAGGVGPEIPRATRPENLRPATDWSGGIGWVGDSLPAKLSCAFVCFWLFGFIPFLRSFLVSLLVFSGWMSIQPTKS